MNIYIDLLDRLIATPSTSRSEDATAQLIEDFLRGQGVLAAVIVLREPVEVAQQRAPVLRHGPGQPAQRQQQRQQQRGQPSDKSLHGVIPRFPYGSV